MVRPVSRNPNANRERAMVLGGLGLLAMAILLLRLFTLQVIHGPRYEEYSERNWIRPKRLPGQRGRILDRHGTLMADIVPSYSVMFDAQHEAFTRDREAKLAVVDRVARLTGQETAVFHDILEKTKAYSYEPIALLRHVDMSTVTTLEERRADLPGVFVETVPTRYYPADSVAAHVLGYVQEVTPQDIEANPDVYRLGSSIGRSGVEASYETSLRGRDGVRFIEVSAVGQRSEQFLTMDPIPPQSGADLRLTLDLGLQRAVEQALDRAPYDGPGEAPAEVKGAAVLLDLRNGDVLAMASRPAYNPNLFNRRITQDEWNTMNRSTQPMFHRAVRGTYPPGSTFKGLTLYGALEEGIVTASQRLGACEGGWQYGNRYFKCWKEAGHGRVNAERAMAESCDTYFYQIAPQLDLEGFKTFTDRFQIDQLTGIDFIGEREGLVPTRDWFNQTYGSRGWSRGVTLNLSIGQGELSFTPLQLAVFTGVLASGKRVTPRLVLDMQDQPGPSERTVDLNLNQGYMDVVRQGMEAAVSNGTARIVDFEKITVAAKTGTAENAGIDHAVFIAYAPAQAPEVALAVYLENRGHGGAAAGPVAREILAAYFGLDDVGTGVLTEGD